MSLAEWFYDLLPDAIGSFLKRRRDKRLNAPKPETFVEHIVAWIKTLVWAVSVVTIVNGLALASFVVPTGSMESTVMAGDFLSREM
jgi:signal peptidase I